MAAKGKAITCKDVKVEEEKQRKANEKIVKAKKAKPGKEEVKGNA